MLYVIRNKKINLPTCASHCELYDPIHQICSIYGETKAPNDPKTALTCENILYKSDISLYERVVTEVVKQEETDIWETSDMFEQHLPAMKTRKSNYPFEPDIVCPINGAYWYTSPCGTFGCWIMQERRQLMRIPTIEEVKDGKDTFPNHYRSPIPLHNHAAHEFLRSYMVWYVHSNGIGEYRVIQGDGTLSPSLIPKSK